MRNSKPLFHTFPKTAALLHSRKKDCM